MSIFRISIKEQRTYNNFVEIETDKTIDEIEEMIEEDEVDTVADIQYLLKRQGINIYRIVDENLSSVDLERMLITEKRGKQ